VLRALRQEQNGPPLPRVVNSASPHYPQRAADAVVSDHPCPVPWNKILAQKIWCCFRLHSTAKTGRKQGFQAFLFGRLIRSGRRRGKICGFGHLAPVGLFEREEDFFLDGKIAVRDVLGAGFVGEQEDRERRKDRGPCKVNRRESLIVSHAFGNEPLNDSRTVCSGMPLPLLPFRVLCIEPINSFALKGLCR